METLIIIIIAIFFMLVIEGAKNKLKAEKEESIKKSFEQENKTCVEIAHINDDYLYSDKDTKEVFVWNLINNEKSCIIKDCQYNKIIEAYPYFLIFDNDNEKLYIIYIKENSHNVLNYNDIISIEIIENGKVVFKKSTTRTVGGAIAGNLIAGGAEAVIGGLSSDTTVHKEIKSITIKLLIRDPNNPSIELTLESLFRVKQATQIKDIINVIIDKINNKYLKETDISVADELIKLSDLKKQGILSEEEFIKQKNQILNQ